MLNFQLNKSWSWKEANSKEVRKQRESSSEHKAMPSCLSRTGKRRPNHRFAMKYVMREFNIEHEDILHDNFNWAFVTHYELLVKNYMKKQKAQK